MSHFPYNTRHTQKTHDSPEVDYTHPIARGLQSFWLLGKNLKDIGRLRNDLTAGTGQSNVITAGETAYDLNNDGLVVGVTDDYHLDAFTVESRVYVEGGLFASDEFAGLGVESATSYQPAILCQVDSADVMRFYMYNGASVELLGNTTLSAGWHTMVWRRTYNAGGGGNIDLFLNGVNDGSTTYTGTNTWTTTQNTTVFEAPRGGSNWPYQASFCKVWNRALTDQEIKQSFEKPYDLLKPRIQFIDISTAAAPPSSFEPAWAMNTNTIIGGM